MRTLVCSGMIFLCLASYTFAEEGSPSGLGQVEILSKPSKSELWIDGEKLGRTPFLGELSAGYHEVVLRKKNYKDQPAKIRVLPGKTIKRKYNLRKRTSGKRKIGGLLLAAGVGFGIGTVVSYSLGERAYRQHGKLYNDYLNASYDSVEYFYGAGQKEYGRYKNLRTMGHVMLGTSLALELGGWLLFRSKLPPDPDALILGP